MRLGVFLLFFLNIVVFSVFVANPSLKGVFNDYVVLHKHDALKKPIRKGKSAIGEFHPAQLVTAMFGHDLEGAPVEIGGKTVKIPVHLLMNMFVFIMFVPMVREAMRSGWRFFFFYMFAGIGGAVLTAFLDPNIWPVVGASGALCGVLTAFAWYVPWARLLLLPIPFTMKARVFVSVFFIGSCALIAAPYIVDADKLHPALFFLIFRVSHFGHVAGMVAAAIFLVVLRLVAGADAVKPLAKPEPPLNEETKAEEAAKATGESGLSPAETGV